MTDTTPRTSPADGDTVSFSELVGGVRKVCDSGRTRPMAWRKRQLDGLIRMMTEGETELVEAIQRDLGRPEAESFGADIGHARVHIKHIAKHMEKWAKPRRVNPGLLSMPSSTMTIPEPLGVALIIAPWNYPVQLVVEPMAAALAAGNAVVCKPSEMAPASAAVLARLIPKYLDEEAVVVVEGGVPETTALLAERYDHIFFTGSTQVGKVVMAAAARHLTPVTLELGGKSPTVIAPDADLKISAHRVAWAKFLNAGQTCIAPDYVLVHETVKDEFIDELAIALGEFYGASPQQSSDFGRIVNERHHGRISGLLDGCGGTVAIGGESDEAEKYIAPTIVVDPDLDSDLMTEEIFGPVLPVVGIESVAAAIDFINERPKPLALYIYSASKDTADRIISRTSSGGVCVNHSLVHILPESLPFGGVGPSGMGSYHGRVGFDSFSHLKSVMRRPTKPDNAMAYPPYTAKKLKILKRVFK